MDIQIRTAREGDAAAVAGIYNRYVIDTHMTFETATVSEGEIARRMSAVSADHLPWLVAVAFGSTIGYAYAAVWNRRMAYRHTVESTIYMDPGHTGKGIGFRLYRQLMEKLCGLPVQAVVAGIALPNEQSVRLHEALGFTKVAHFEQVGYKLDRWIDVGYWELLLQSAGKAGNLRRPGVAM